MSDFVTLCRRWVMHPEQREMTLRQVALIGVVADEPGPHHVRDLAAKLSVSKPVVTRAVTALKVRGILTSHRPAADRRHCIVELTEAGRELRASWSQ
jgi:DNA-binding MarR family transcriptional regulator